MKSPDKEGLIRLLEEKKVICVVGDPLFEQDIRTAIALVDELEAGRDEAAERAYIEKIRAERDTKGKR